MLRSHRQPIQYSSHSPSQIASIIRLVKHVLPGIFRHLSGIASREQNLQTRPQAPRCFGQFMAAHAFRHDDVSEQQIDSFARLEDGQR